MSSEYFILAAAALFGLLIVAAAALKGWQGWLAFKTRELDQHHPHAIDTSSGNGQMTSRIEIADLKERIRKLEAIAAGVDL